ncbi:MAG TPA: hypothetical protein VKA76_00705 [Gammaproteobacteria bacterium]|nr:hypothetical protein [Gammaproteobacteria bacterium]
MKPLLLTTPEQHDYDDPTVERNERRLQRWLDQLPLMNPPAALPALLEALEGCNAQRMDGRERLRLLECYRPAVAKLFMTVLQGRVTRLRGTPAERERVVEQLEGCCLAMAGGYKLVLSAAAHGAERQYAKQLPLALLRAMEHLAQGLLHSYRYYRPTPPFALLELHRIYAHAARTGHPDAVPDSMPGGGQPISLASLYRQMLLLTLADPYRLADGELASVFASLVPYAPLSRLERGAAWEGDGEGLYLVDMASDSPPRACVRLSSPGEAEDPWLLDATAAVKAMHRRLAQLPAEQRRGSPEAVLLRQLLPEVAAGERRAQVRRDSDQQALLLAGVEAVHRYLSGQPQADAGDGAAAIVEPALWDMVDRSEGGLQLAGDERGISHLQVGELVGVVSDAQASTQPVCLAVVRWLRRDRDRRLQLGLEIIPGVPAPVRCGPQQAPPDGAVECLFIPSQAGGAAATLLAPAELYEPAARLLVQAGDRGVPVCAGTALQQTPCFDHFHFSADRDA